MKQKSTHNKLKNSGILFELLTRQITLDVLANKKSNAVDIFKKYFASNTELFKEYRLYSALTSTKLMSEDKANRLIETVIKASKKLDQNKLNTEKYNLIKEVKDQYSLDQFLKLNIDNYKTYASIYNVLSLSNSDTFSSPTKLSEYKENIIESITTPDVKSIENGIDDYLKQDKETRILTYKVLVENFNKEYTNLLPEQKETLRYFINYPNDNEGLRKHLNKELSTIKNQISELKNTINDEVITIKLSEIVKLISPIKENVKIKDNDVLNILQYQELINELKSLDE